MSEPRGAGHREPGSVRPGVAGRRWAACALALATVLAWPLPAPAGYYDGARMLALCADTRPGEPRADVAKYNTCVGYLSGLWDATEAWMAWGHAPRMLCMPAGVGLDRLRQAFLRALRQHPERRGESAAPQAIAAFLAEWECP